MVDDDAAFVDVLSDLLSNHAFVVSVSRTAAESLSYLKDHDPDLVLLDLMLPDQRGDAVFLKLRELSTAPIVFLTASKSDRDHINGLEIGALDYIHKSVHPDVLLARVRAILHRAGKSTVGSGVVGLKLDSAKQTVTFEGQNVGVTGLEFEILRYIVERAGESVTREELYEQILDRTYDGIDRGIDIHVSRIRRKLVACNFDGERLRSIRSVGYVMVGDA